jgi:hypothetical protein
MPPRAKGRAPPRSQGKGKGKGKGKGAKNEPSLKMDDDEVDDLDGDNQGPLVSLDLQSSDESDASMDDDASEDESEEEDSDEGGGAKATAAASDDEDDDDDAEDSEEDASEEEEDEDSDEDRDGAIDTAWGRSAAAYHGGDTADLEIGQDAEEAREEAAIARKMQKQRRARETEDDFIILGDGVAGASAAPLDGGGSLGGSVGAGAIAVRDLASMGDSERLAALRAEAPELEGLLAQLEDALGEASLLGLALAEAHGMQVETKPECSRLHRE